MMQENVRPYAYVITHMALSWVYDGCSDDSDAFKGNAATADGIKNMVNLPRKSQYNWETIQTQFKIAGKFKRLMKKYFQQKTRWIVLISLFYMQKTDKYKYNKRM